MPDKYTPAVHLETYPDLICEESLEALRGFKGGPGAYLRLDRSEQLRELANKMRVPNEQRNTRQETAVFLEHTRNLLLRAVAIKKKGIAVGVAVRYYGGTSIVRKIQRDFIVVLDTKETSVPQEISVV